MTAVARQVDEVQVFDAGAEFDRQVEVLAGGAHPRLSDAAAARLRAEALARCSGAVAGPGRVPFVLVVAGVPAAESMPHITVNGLPGFVSADSVDLDTFGTIEQVTVPQGSAYLLVDVQRGDEYANWSPDEAFPAIFARGRTPLTVAEGIAVLTVAPFLLEKNRCFMLLASRGTDRRVPALWISGGTGKDGRANRGAPKLGWCWAGNRHTWLGHASAGGRIG